MNAEALSKLSESLRFQAEVELLAIMTLAAQTHSDRRIMIQRFVDFVIAAAVNEVATSLARVREDVTWQDTNSFTRDGV